jgi:membrane protein
MTDHVDTERSAPDRSEPSDTGQTGWGEILRRTRSQLVEDRATLVAAGVAFYIFLGVIPALAAIISIYGMVMDPEQVQRHFEYLTTVLPAETKELERQMLEIASDRAVAGWGAVLGLLFMLWSGSKATKALIVAINLADDRAEQRGFFKLTLLSLGLTLAGVVFAVLAIGLIGVLPAVLNAVGLGNATQTLLTWLRWPLLIVGFCAVLAVLYRYAPSRPAVPWRWVSAGAVVAVILWAGGSLLLSWYVSRFGDYNRTYGSLGAIVLLQLWLFLTAFAVVVGAELNSELERAARGSAAPDRDGDETAGENGFRQAS